MKPYDPSAIEAKWQKYWQKRQVFRAREGPARPKYYVLVEFPYPSGDGLHVGHPRPYTALDSVARMRRLQGHNVLFPMGWDSFGLPTENYAIKYHIHPDKVTKKNIARFKEQMQMLGLSFDWSREIDSSDPDYYRWTQWIFIQLFKRGLAYKAEMAINWCPACKIGLANEEVVAGSCERCGTAVEKRSISQWMLKITAYADRLLDDLDTVDYLEKIRAQQQHWIGRSQGAEIRFPLEDSNQAIIVFTTRPDTLPGATYMVLAPEHPLVEQLEPANRQAVAKYCQQARSRTDTERGDVTREKTGVPLAGIRAINPLNNRRLPVWVADYVLPHYGTGAIMAVPGGDERDHEFANKHNLPIEPVEKGDIAAMIQWLEKNEHGKAATSYRLRDWVFSRQRYWGEPIPLVHCEKCGWMPLPEEQLPLELPQVESYQPTDSGQSPLAAITDWVNTTCPKCGGRGKRETDTMPNWAGSSWYFLRYTDPRNNRALADKEKLDYWLPVDWYNGGMEHTTLHLLYSRFWHKFLYDLGIVSTPEPYKRRTSHGMVLAEDNSKMSKSRGNVINPDDMVEQYGADSFRLYELFMGAFDQAIPWSTQGLIGCRRFLERVWNLQAKVTNQESCRPQLEHAFHRAMQKVTLDVEAAKFNTAVSALMELVNAIQATGSVTREEYRTLLILLNPFAPHISEELWQRLGYPGYLHQQTWPHWDEEKIAGDTVTIAVQINGKLAGTIKANPDSSKETVRELARKLAAKRLADKQIAREIYVPGKVYNFVTRKAEDFSE